MGCSDKTRFGDITRIEALSWFENSAKQLEIKLVDAHYDDSEMGKVVEFYGGMPSTQGPLKLEGRRYYFGQCSLGVIVTGKVSNYDNDRASEFLRSTKRVDITPSWAAPSSIADRLQALKDLLDRKVITPEEYAAKRKEILKSL